MKNDKLRVSSLELWQYLNCRICKSIFFFLLFLATGFSQNQFLVINLYKDQSHKNFLLNKNPLQKEKSDFTVLTESIGYTLRSPLRWDSNDLIMLCGFTAATVSSFLLDDETRVVMLKNQDKFYDRLAPIGFSYGAPQYAVPGAIAIYLTGLIAENEWLHTTGLMMTESLITIGIVQIPARIIAGRSRPLTGEKNSSFKLFEGFGQLKSSFISGHSAIAFSFSTILAEQIDNIWATIGLYAFASLTPLSRLYEDKHWLSDTVIGFSYGCFYCKYHN